MTPAVILILGGGAREHALVWRLGQDPGVAQVHVAPGNPGMSDVATTHPQTAAGDLDAVAQLCANVRPDLVVVGPEAPLAAGVADRLGADGIAVFGPTRAAARLETSKAFCRSLAASVGIPMAEGASFEDPDDAVAFARALAVPVAVKADGLAGGKGVTMCQTLVEAETAIRAIGGRVIVERALIGPEASLMAICDGERAVSLPLARDHKRAFDGDAGPNTGGMGAFSPLPDLSDAMAERLLDVFHRPALAEMARRGTPFSGVLYAGLLLAGDGPRLLEFNVRFGDPEAEAVLPRLEGNLAAAMLAASRGELRTGGLTTTGAATVALVLAAQGYPAEPRIGDEIRGIEHALDLGALVFHGATGVQGGRIVTAGGRVLTLVGRGADVDAARRQAYEAAAQIAFPGMHFRTDIGAQTPALVAAR